MRNFPDWIAAFQEYASYGEAPDRMYKWVAISTMAGALRRRVWIDQKYFVWTPCFYIVLVAPPGIVSKSTTASIGMNLLKQVPGITMGPDVVTWQKLVQDLAGARELVYNPKDGLYYPMSCLSIASSEFGNLLNPADRDMVDILVSLWDGQTGTFQKSTKTSGDDSVENPWINIIACTTPAWIAGNFPEYMVGGGFTSRCIFVYAEEKARKVAYPALNIPKDFEEKKAKLIADLETISTMFGEMHLSHEAIVWGEDWYHKHWSTPSELPPAQFGGYLARKQSHIHKLAMILSAAEGETLQVESKHLQLADIWVTELEEDVVKVFSRIGSTPITRASDEALDWAKRKGLFSEAQFRDAMSRTLGSNDFQQVFQGLQARNRVRRIDGASGVMYRYSN